MKRFPANPRDPAWFYPHPEQRCHLPASVRPWLLEARSLTAHLRGLCGDGFRVQVLGQHWVRPQPGEAALLGLGLGRCVLLREVHLYCGGDPRVYARTVIPRGTLQGRLKALERLGSRPLGELLFGDPAMRRGPVQVARVAAGSHLYQAAMVDQQCRVASIWGRRSVFRLDGRPLLVTEVFLPGLMSFPEH